LDSNSNSLSSHLKRKHLRDQEPSDRTKTNLVTTDVDEHGGEDDDLREGIDTVTKWREEEEDKLTWVGPMDLESSSLASSSLEVSAKLNAMARAMRATSMHPMPTKRRLLRP
jgi:hypothetical protein